jgi:hypothetical protein
MTGLGEQAIESRLSRLTEGLGPFAPRQGSDQTRLASSMRDEIKEIENLVRDRTTSRIEYQLAIAIRNYSAWYLRGDERAPYLEKVVVHLRKAIDTITFVDAKVELTRILIEEKLVRDLDSALKLADELKKTGQFPEWMSSTVEKAMRWSGKAEVPLDNDFSNLSAAPAAIREERTKLRKFLIDAVKAGNRERTAVLATRLYNLGLLAAYLYGEWDASAGVPGAVFDDATRKLHIVKSSFNFRYLGRIADAGFLSSTDYRRIEQALGSTSKTIEVRHIKMML